MSNHNPNSNNPSSLSLAQVNPANPASQGSQGSSGLSQSNPIRTISSPTGLHGKGLAVAARTKPKLSIHPTTLAPPPPNIPHNSNNSKHIHGPSSSIHSTFPPQGSSGSSGLPPMTVSPFTEPSPSPPQPQPQPTVTVLKPAPPNPPLQPPSSSQPTILPPDSHSRYAKPTVTTPNTSIPSNRTHSTNPISDPLFNPPTPLPTIVKPTKSDIPPSNPSTNSTKSHTTTTTTTSTNTSQMDQTSSSSKRKNLQRLKISPTRSFEIKKKITSSIAKTLTSSRNNTPTKNIREEHPSASSVTPTITQTQPVTQVPPPNKTLSLEEETDHFLSPMPLKPTPLISNNKALPTIQSLASRRAWGDVLHFTNEYLNSSSSSNQPFYLQLKNISSSATISLDREYFLRQQQKENDQILNRLQTETCQLIAYRLQSMLKLRRYVDLGREIESLNLLKYRFLFPNEVMETTDGGKTEDDTYVQQITDPSLPLWVPFGLKILAAQSLQYTEEPQICIDTLYAMKQEVEKQLSSTFPPSQKFAKQWKPQIDIALSNTFIRMNEWRLALNSLDSVLDSIPMIVEHDIAHISTMHGFSEGGKGIKLVSSILCHALKIEIVSRLIRVFLQFGGLSQAQILYNSLASDFRNFHTLMSSVNGNADADADADVDANPSEDNAELHPIRLYIRGSKLIQQTSTQMILNEGLLTFAQYDFKTAMDKFSSAISMERETMQREHGHDQPIQIPKQQFLSTDFTEFLNPDQYLMTHALNNLALCSLYRCEVNHAIELMEELVKESPTLFLTEVLVLNLCTLYELGADIEGSGRKKKILQNVAKRFFLHDIATENFRITE